MLENFSFKAISDLSISLFVNTSTVAGNIYMPIFIKDISRLKMSKKSIQNFQTQPYHFKNKSE